MTRFESDRPMDDPLGPLGDIYRPERWRRGYEIPVARHRQILVWPLVLRLDDGDEWKTGSRSRIEAAIEAAEKALDASSEATASADHPRWEAIDDLLDHVRAPHSTFPGAGETWEAQQNDAQAYGEFVYFYDFLQKSLFRPKPTSDAPPPFRVWRRTDIAALEAVLRDWNGARRFKARVERFNLYLFRVGAAVAVIELDFDGEVDWFKPAKPPEKSTWESVPAMLADVQLAVDRLRRAYTPYFAVRHKDDDDHGPQGGPVCFVWKTASGAPIYDAALDAERRDRPATYAPDRSAPSKPEPAGEDTELCGQGRSAPPWTPDPLDVAIGRLRKQDADTARRRAAPLADHWRQALRPLVFAGYHPDVDRSPAVGEAPSVVWRHILDERIPVMSFVSLTGAAAFLGGAPTGSIGAREDLRLVSRGDWVRLCFADPPGTDPLPYAPHFLADFEKDNCYDRFFPSDAADGTTRYMFAGYHFSVVGAGDYFERLITHHFRRHYFQMALLVNMELAALLATSSRITEAVARLEKKANERHGGRTARRKQFRAELMTIQEDFLSFVHRFRFTDVSNQIQPSELYRMWRKSMRIDGLYDDVKEELAAAVAFATAGEQAETGRDAGRLAGVAAIGAPFALAFSFMPIYSEIVKNTDRWAPDKTANCPAVVNGCPPTASPDWFGSALWASWPLLFVTATFLFLSGGILKTMSKRAEHPVVDRPLHENLYAAGIGFFVAASCTVLLMIWLK